MIRAVANKRLDLSESEHKYYLLLIQKYSDTFFRDLFESDNNGIVVSVSPPLDGQTPMAIVFFMLNVMFSQRMRALDLKIKKIESIEEKVSRLISDKNVV